MCKQRVRSGFSSSPWAAAYASDEMAYTRGTSGASCSSDQGSQGVEVTQVQRLLHLFVVSHGGCISSTQLGDFYTAKGTSKGPEPRAVLKSAGGVKKALSGCKCLQFVTGSHGREYIISLNSEGRPTHDVGLLSTSPLQPLLPLAPAAPIRPSQPDSDAPPPEQERTSPAPASAAKMSVASSELPASILHAKLTRLEASELMAALLRHLGVNGVNASNPVSLLHDLAQSICWLEDDGWPADTLPKAKKPVFTETCFGGSRQCSVKIPAPDGSGIEVSVRLPLSSSSRNEVKQQCALKMIARIAPADVRTWGDLVAYVQDRRQDVKKRKEAEAMASAEAGVASELAANAEAPTAPDASAAAAAAAAKDAVTTSPQQFESQGEMRCRYLRVSNLSSDLNQREALQGLLTSMGHRIEAVDVESDGTALVVMSCTREAIAIKGRLQSARPQLSISFDSTRASALVSETMAAQAKEAAEATKEYVGEPPPRPRCKYSTPPPRARDDDAADDDADGQSTGREYLRGYNRGHHDGYQDGHADAARDIESNARAQVAQLTNELEEEHERELEGALAALRDKYERLKAEAVTCAVEAARERVPPHRNEGRTRASAPDPSLPGPSPPDPSPLPLPSAAARRSSSHDALSRRSEERLIRKHLALRQYVEMRRVMLKAAGKTWRLVMRRGSLMTDVLDTFGAVTAKARGERLRTKPTQHTMPCPCAHCLSSRAPRPLCPDAVAC